MAMYNVPLSEDNIITILQDVEDGIGERMTVLREPNLRATLQHHFKAAVESRLELYNTLAPVIGWKPLEIQP
jgi:hypothetical protein